MTLAGEARKLIIPFRIENAEPKGGLRARLVDLHRIDAFDNQDAAIAELIEAVKRLRSEICHRAHQAHGRDPKSAREGIRDDRREERKKKRAVSRPWIYGGIGLAGIAAVVAAFAWMGAFIKPLPPVPEWTFKSDIFIGKPIPFEWKIDHKALTAWKKRFADAEILYELQSARDAEFRVEAKTEDYAENERKNIRGSNAARFWRVSAIAVDTKSRQPLSDSARAWSHGVLVTQYDSAYQRIATTGQVLVYVSKSDNQDIFKWLDKNGAYKGLDIHLAKAVVTELSTSRRTGRTLEMVVRGLPWEDMLHAPSRGQADLIVSSITKVAQREPDYGLLFSDSYFCTSYALIYRVGERDRLIKEMIRDRIVGYQTKTTGEDVAKALANDTPFKTKNYASTELIVKAVAAAEVDFGITDTPFAEVAELEDRIAGKHVLAHKLFTAADLPPDIPPVQEYALAVPAGDTRLVDVINSLLRSMKEQGKLTSLFREAAAEYVTEKEYKPGSRTDPRQRPWECAR